MPMIPDLDIYRAANLLVKILDQDAPIHAHARQRLCAAPQNMRKLISQQ